MKEPITFRTRERSNLSSLPLLRTRPRLRKFRVYTRKDIDHIPQILRLTDQERIAMKAVSHVLPFRVNNYVLQLIDWSNVPEDPIYQLTFPQPGMLALKDFKRMYSLVKRDAPAAEILTAARTIQDAMNPHPAGQLEYNVPIHNDEALPGLQHKYRETVLFFPAAGQTCHSYCTYCFRWAQFVGIDELKFANHQAGSLVDYLTHHPDVSSVLMTGGDPLVMKASVLGRYIEPLLDPSLDHLQSIRIGSKAPAYWPYRFVTDPDSDDLLRLFEKVVKSGRHLALMAHFTHPRELETRIAQKAIQRIQSTGAVVRCQAPLIRHINDSSEIWASMWNKQVQLGAVPYYMFVERDTGPRHYFEVPLARAAKIFDGAFRKISGLGRTVRGPSMSATPGKVLIDGVTTIRGEKVFALKFLQGRDPEWAGQMFYAKYDPQATWLDQLRPAFGEKSFFFEEGLKQITADSSCGEAG
jgi:KamA family protein